MPGNEATNLSRHLRPRRDLEASSTQADRIIDPVQARQPEGVHELVEGAERLLKMLDNPFNVAGSADHVMM